MHRSMKSMGLLLLAIALLFTSCTPAAPKPAESVESTNISESMPAAETSTDIPEETSDTGKSESETVNEPPLTPEETEHIHTYRLYRTISPTCTEGGSSQYICDCEDVEERDQTAPLGHDWQLSSTEKPEYQKQGKEVYACSRCSAYKETVLPALDIGDVDMCGEPIFQKGFEHHSNKDWMQDIFDIYNRDYDDSEITGAKGEIPPTWIDSYEIYKYASPIFPSIWVWPDNTPVYLRQNDATVRLQQALYDQAENIIRQLGIDSAVSKKEAIIRINDYLCDLKYYDSEYNFNGGGSYDRIWNCLTESRAVCFDYAVAFQVLCLAAGIECYYITSEEMNHAWNLVFFSDGSYLSVDCTWNDSSGDRTKYLLIDTPTLWQTHTLPYLYGLLLGGYW